MRTNYCGFLLAVTLLGGCKDNTLQPTTVELPPTRIVATVYAAHSSSGNTPCFRGPAATSPIVVTLSDGQLADLVSMEGSMVQTGQEYWLHVYPRIGHRPSCYIDSRNLVPVS